jgi:hypothetical protein
MLDFNHSNLSETRINQLINELIERAEPPSENYRQYLGASSIGSGCLRKIQYDWMCDPVFPARIKDIFARGHFWEDLTRQHLIAAGFRFAPPERLKFTAANGLFRGHADGIIISGPQLPALRYPCLFEHKCVKAKGWKAIEHDGLVGSTRRTPGKFKSTWPIWASPNIQRCLPSATPIPPSGSFFSCRSMHNSHKP